MGRIIRGNILTDAGAGINGNDVSQQLQSDGSNSGTNHEHTNLVLLEKINIDSNQNLKYGNQFIITSNETDFQW